MARPTAFPGALAVAALAAAWGCGADDDGSGSGSGGCVSDLDCARPAICHRGMGLGAPRCALPSGVGEACLLDADCEDGLECDDEQCVANADCFPNHAQRCVDNDVYYYDSCGVQGSLRTSCDVGEACVEVGTNIARCEADRETCSIVIDLEDDPCPRCSGSCNIAIRFDDLPPPEPGLDGHTAFVGVAAGTVVTRPLEAAGDISVFWVCTKRDGAGRDCDFSYSAGFDDGDDVTPLRTTCPPGGQVRVEISPYDPRAECP